MSVLYSIDVTLDLFYSEENIKYIVAKGKEKKFTYFDCEFRKCFSVDDVVRKKMHSNSDDEDRDVYIKFQDTNFFLWFFKSDNGQLIFSIGSFGYRWDRDFSNFSKGQQIHMIDFARYIRLIVEVCSEVPILALSTDADNREEINYPFQNSVIAIVDIGFLEKDIAHNIDYGRDMVESFLMNGIYNQVQFFDKNTSQLIETPIQECYDILKTGFPAVLYAKKDGVMFKMELGFGWFGVYPLEPYFMKKGHGSEEEKIDVAFYVQRLLELCENFAIYELKTFF